MTLLAFAGPVQNSAPLNVTASPNPATGFFDDETHLGDVSTTATPTGGLAPYAHSWTWQSGTVLSAPGGTTNADITFISGSRTTAVYRDTVTDHAGNTAHVDVTVSIA